MNLPTRTFAELVRDMAAAITASAGKLVDFSAGSILRAVIEANAAIMMWAQWLMVLTLGMTRAATSEGTDLDSWMADFSLTRAPPRPARGTVTLSRYSAGTGIAIPAGTSVKSRDGKITYRIVADPTLPAWSSSAASYVLPAGVTSIDLPIVASHGGANGNVLRETITLLASPVAGIDTVSNAAALSGGTDAESDEAFRTRFRMFFAARSRATSDAICHAIAQVDSSLKYVIQENADARGLPRIGNIAVFLASSSGSVSDDLIGSVGAAVDRVRALGTTFSVLPAEILPVQVNLTLTLPPSLGIADLSDALDRSIHDYVSGIAIGGVLSVSRIVQAAYAADSRIVNISQVLCNGQAMDMIAASHQTFSVSDTEYHGNASQ